MFDWNDVRTFLAVARSGSTLAAAKALKVNQTTVSRRLEALEAALGVKLAERSQSGSRLTEAGEAVLAEAELLERAAEGLARSAAQFSRGLSGTIRLTTSETVANTMLSSALAEFRKLHPEVTIELVVTDRALDIEAGEADIAVRGGPQLEDSDLIARRLHFDDFTLYCSRDYVERRGVPASLDDLNDHALVTPLEGLPGAAWMAARAPRAEIACRCNTLSNLMQAVRAGLGIGPMQCLIADTDPEVFRLFPPIPELCGATWVVTRRDLKDIPRIRAFIDFLTTHIAIAQRDLEGRAAARRDEKAKVLADLVSRVSPRA